MKSKILILTILSLFNSNLLKSQNISSEIFQENFLEKFVDVKTSPLTEKEMEDYDGHFFYPIDKKFIVIAKFSKTNSENIFLELTNGEKKNFKIYGTLKFKLENKDFNFIVLEDQNKIIETYDLIIPYTDVSTVNSIKKVKYIYLNKKDIKKGKVILDFNKSLKPICLYSSRYKCPLSPMENDINIAITAGDKIEYILIQAK